MDIRLQFKEVVRVMLLPVSGHQEDKSFERVITELAANGIDQDSSVEFLRLQYEVWSQDSKLDELLASMIRIVLMDSDAENGMLFADHYFTLHHALLKNPFFNFELTTIMLSHLRLVYNLAKKEKMSAAKIANVVRSIDSRLDFVSWKEVQLILRELGLLPILSKAEVEELYLEDESLEEEYFADASLDDALVQIGQVAAKLQFSGDATRLLRTLSNAANRHLPYLQMLHYQCLISAFYDHVLSAPYEFTPRGTVATWLFSKYDDLLPTSNPFLNNAKAVDLLDMNWANSRKTKEYEQARVFVELLKGIDGMGFAAAQELTSWIRRWLVRYIRQESRKIIPIEANITSSQRLAVLQGIANAPTATFGILEQRFVDVISDSLHPKVSGWRSRGLSDSVNSNNLSKKKLGDCDFQNSTSFSLVCYEGHGGILSAIYLQGHIRTFLRAFKLRKEELEHIADISQWSFEVVFVAYGFEIGLPLSFTADGLTIKIQYLTFEQLLIKADISSKIFNEIFQQLFIDVINKRETPTLVREKVLKIVKAAK